MKHSDSHFRLHAVHGRARRGTVHTMHGDIETPAFMPIATVGSVKTLTADDVRALGADVILGNTYHLLLRPGEEILRKVNGLRALMRWEGPMLTDSGGYQVFSLAKLNTTDEDGVTFQSHISGASIRLTPERSMEIQEAIGSSIRMQFDDVAAGDSSRERYQDAMERSLRWAKRSKVHFNTLHDGSSVRPLLFGIVQGGTYEDLRQASLEGLCDIGFDGYAIGGLSVGEARSDAFRIVDQLTKRMPEDAPRYFMGGGMPEEIVYYVSRGVDMFDCVLPTRNARHGTIFVWPDDQRLAVRRAFDCAVQGGTDEEIAAVLYRRIHVTNEVFADDMSPIDEFASVLTSCEFSRAYLRHLFQAGEALGPRLATLQNLGFYQKMMHELREYTANPL